MLKQTIEYTDFDDNKVAETLHFNLTKTELTDNLHLKEELEDLQRMFRGEARSLESSEIKTILDLVKTFMRLSYGVRSADGKRFAKSPEMWTEFTQTAAYDAFLYSLFENPEKAIEFMTGIFPADLREQAQKAIKEAEKTTVVGGADISTTPTELSPEQLAQAAQEFAARNNLQQ